MDSDVKTRLRQFISYLNKSEREFCASIGASAAFVQNLGASIKRQKLEAINAAYPRLNLDWLISGRGDMLMLSGDYILAPKIEKSKPKAAPDPVEGMGGRLLALVESQQKTIENLTESNNRLSRMLDEYKKHSAAAAGIPAVSAVD